ncbi:GerAB/ArcD/ProY family transporter [Clostridium estertheticum]|uniref:GerAB/ArcD/ProY family transporter n=1 Tax=Clostridium estertheticum TaxID=238834 RepID=UPI001CF1C35A|nr:endospore germination permease [Clostridium estertheticum]MCB2352834.1 spore germination protein [Clostridium estertheticum]WAG40140.1 spore germination protein [Clostridium estertheticum]
MEGNSNKKQSYLTVSQFALIIFGSIVGVGILSLPNGVVKTAHQDGWISTLIGGIYPLYVVVIGSYIGKKFPKDNILVLSKRYFGKFFGSIFNLIFATYFIFITSMIASYYINLMRTYIVGFLSPIKIIAILFICIIYAVSKDLKVIGRISEISFYLTIILILSSIAALRYGNITNIYPVFGSGFSSIARGTVKSAFAYAGAEIILLIYPLLKEKNKMLVSSLISVTFVIIMYVWCVFITIYYLGPDIVNKSYWSFLLVTGGLTISAINNYKYIFILLWSLIAFKSMSIDAYASIHILKDFTHRIEIKKICFFMYPLFVYLAFKYGNEISRQNISDSILPLYSIFNLLYMTSVAIFVFFKGGGKA